MDYRVDITPRSHRAVFEGQEIGHSEFGAARWLQANRGAADSDTLITTFDGAPSMRGPIGWWAAHTVKENERLSPTLAKYRPPSF